MPWHVGSRCHCFQVLLARKVGQIGASNAIGELGLDLSRLLEDDHSCGGGARLRFWAEGGPGAAGRGLSSPRWGQAASRFLKLCPLPQLCEAFG